MHRIITENSLLRKGILGQSVLLVRGKSAKRRRGRVMWVDNPVEIGYTFSDYDKMPHVFVQPNINKIVDPMALTVENYQYLPQLTQTKKKGRAQ